MRKAQEVCALAGPTKCFGGTVLASLTSPAGLGLAAFALAAFGLWLLLFARDSSQRGTGPRDSGAAVPALGGEGQRVGLRRDESNGKGFALFERRVPESVLVWSQIFGFIAICAFSLVQIAAGFLGISEGVGLVWAWLAIGIAVVFRLTLPLTIGAFFGAMNVWGWHWALALLFAAPGLAFLVPGVMAAVLSWAGSRRR